MQLFLSAQAETVARIRADVLIIFKQNAIDSAQFRCLDIYRLTERIAAGLECVVSGKTDPLRHLLADKELVIICFVQTIEPTKNIWICDIADERICDRNLVEIEI